MFRIILLIIVFVVCIIEIHANSVDHASRLNEIISKKTAESLKANKHAESLQQRAKSRAEGINQRKIEDSNSISDAKQRHEEVVSSISTSNPTQESHKPSNHKMKGTLEVHGVSHALVKEINNMASASISREAIIKHVQTHFPNKDPHEWNDIVISAINVAGKSMPDPLQTNKASQNEVLQQKRKFQQAKQSLEHKQDL